MLNYRIEVLCKLMYINVVKNLKNNIRITLLELLFFYLIQVNVLTGDVGIKLAT